MKISNWTDSRALALNYFVQVYLHFSDNNNSNIKTNSCGNSNS